MLRMGGTYLNLNVETSSSKKGETLLDTVRVMSEYADALVIRHPSADVFEQLAELPWYLATAGAGGAQRYFYDRTSELFYDNGALPAGEEWALPQELEALVRHLPSIPLAALRNP